MEPLQIARGRGCQSISALPCPVLPRPAPSCPVLPRPALPGRARRPPPSASACLSKLGVRARLAALGPAAAQLQHARRPPSADRPPALARWRISQSLFALGARDVPAPSLRESQCAALSPPPPEESPGPPSEPASHKTALTLLEPPSIYKLPRPSDPSDSTHPH
ncbi:hypothetical protein B0J12DRAFT_697988 [Macrophomina phaseolina]|uniref:Uncharacterized protein n=1 Tax=Macrophomina phaseolina TaxID=35725 RepID=A0ABQ8GIA2_9PEZI|nr:hypothetical protein B0J12DRAFT_697988 [Macrophomina phaseolina]